jgi:glucosamine-6-phosphate deaminase
MKLIIRPHAGEAVELVAGIIGHRLRENLHLVLGLATGRTMEAVYARLVQRHQMDGLDFSGCRTFNLDEYVGLPGNHCNAYRYYMNQHLFDKVNIDLRNTHLPNGMAEDLTAECHEYEAAIVRCGGIDLQLLGIGNNGHLGFNEPLSGLNSRTHVQVLSQATLAQNAPLFSGLDNMPRCAITMGTKTILESRECLLLATGEEKAAIISQALEGPVTSMISASALQMHPDCLVVLDEAAADGLKNKEYYYAMFETLPELELCRAIVGNESNSPLQPQTSTGTELMRQPNEIVTRR